MEALEFYSRFLEISGFGKFEVKAGAVSGLENNHKIYLSINDLALVELARKATYGEISAERMAEVIIDALDMYFIGVSSNQRKLIKREKKSLEKDKEWAKMAQIYGLDYSTLVKKRKMTINNLERALEEFSKLVNKEKSKVSELNSRELSTYFSGVLLLYVTSKIFGRDYKKVEEAEKRLRAILPIATEALLTYLGY